MESGDGNARRQVPLPPVCLSHLVTLSTRGQAGRESSFLTIQTFRKIAHKLPPILAPLHTLPSCLSFVGFPITNFLPSQAVVRSTSLPTTPKDHPHDKNEKYSSSIPRIKSQSTVEPNLSKYNGIQIDSYQWRRPRCTPSAFHMSLDIVALGLGPDLPHYVPKTKPPGGPQHRKRSQPPTADHKPFERSQPLTADHKPFEISQPNSADHKPFEISQHPHRRTPALRDIATQLRRDPDPSRYHSLTADRKTRARPRQRKADRKPGRKHNDERADRKPGRNGNGERRTTNPGEMATAKGGPQTRERSQRRKADHNHREITAGRT
ncbi:hypothetical protein DFJ77DRAFT_245328 [Powellomyces hirtus]|nr:hypothetical protein DFJ77DRAFT_245328 [Powellomyces hirtus]